jgi:hypothetical protein
MDENHTFYIGWLARANTASSLQNESSGSVRTILAFGNAPGHGMRSNGLNHLLSYLSAQTIDSAATLGSLSHSDPSSVRRPHHHNYTTTMGLSTETRR